MSNKKFENLLAKEFEEGLTDKEREWLQSYIGTHPQAAEIYHGHAAVSKVLNSTSIPAPSENLGKRIMNSIDPERYTVRKPASVWSRPVNGFSRLFSPARALTFATGLVIGAVLMLLVAITEEQSVPGSDEFLGTIGLHGAGRFLLIHEAAIDHDDITGSLRFSANNDMISCDVDIDAEASFELTLRYDTELMRFYGVTPRDNNNISFVKDSDNIHVSGSGVCRYCILFQQLSFTPQEINLILRSNNSEVLSKSFRFEKTEYEGLKQ